MVRTRAVATAAFFCSTWARNHNGIARMKRAAIQMRSRVYTGRSSINGFVARLTVMRISLRALLTLRPSGLWARCFHLPWPLQEPDRVRGTVPAQGRTSVHPRRPGLHKKPPQAWLRVCLQNKQPIRKPPGEARGCTGLHQPGVRDSDAEAIARHA